MNLFVYIAFSIYTVIQQRYFVHSYTALLFGYFLSVRVKPLAQYKFCGLMPFTYQRGYK